MHVYMLLYIHVNLHEDMYTLPIEQDKERRGRGRIGEGGMEGRSRKGGEDKNKIFSPRVIY